MAVTAKTLGIDKFGVSDRLALVEEIRASIYADVQQFPLSGSQREELDRRVAEDDEFPEAVLPRDEVKASVRARLERR